MTTAPERHPTVTSAAPLIIVADDLTGAADSAVALAGRTTARVAFTAEAVESGTSVVALDTDTRYATAQEAAATVATAVAMSGPTRRIYKKVDSTLRGNVATEIAATARALDHVGRPGQVAAVALAFPATGRTTLGGVVHVGGQPLAAGPAGGDAVALLHAAGSRVRAVGLAEVERGEGYVSELLHRAAEEDLDALVFDAVTDEHLAVVAAALDAPDTRAFGVGSGGLTRHLAAPAGPPPVEPTVGAGAVVTVVGSYAAEARAQAQRLRSRYAVRTVVVPAVGPLTAAVAAARGAVRGGDDVLVIIDPDAPLDLDNSLVVADRLAEVVAGSGQPSAVVATGGETAKAWLRQVGASALTVHRELAPGVVLSSTDVPGTPVLVSKAGAFGGPDTLADALRVLRQVERLAAASG